MLITNLAAQISIRSAQIAAMFKQLGRRGGRKDHYYIVVARAFTTKTFLTRKNNGLRYHSIGLIQMSLEGLDFTAVCF